ncbi:hypothetical protein WA026_016715 [Henosepilachna vigintioctopunctata]|uniref:Uncharacterized protein n=1 Tax=Henosepilachna vigintioctopunctata TaxID=420089 RepID=A0AAW1USB8_9CUCU
MIRNFLTSVHNFFEMSETERHDKSPDYIYNESVRKTKKTYKTKIHVLEKPSREVDFHVEGPRKMNFISRTSISDLKYENEPNLLKRNKSRYDNEDKCEKEIIDIPMSSRELDRRSSHSDLSKLYLTSRKPFPPLTHKEIKDIQKKSNHDEVMSTHITRMKEGIQRLQEIAQRFNCTENYKEDIEYIIENVKKAIDNAS